MGRTRDVARERGGDGKTAITPEELAGRDSWLAIERAPGTDALMTFLRLVSLMPDTADTSVHEKPLAWVSGREGQRRIRKHLDELRDCRLDQVRGSKGSEIITIGGILDWAKIDYSDGRNVVRWQIGKAFAEMTDQSEIFAQIDIETAERIRGKYGRYLYLWLAGRGWRHCGEGGIDMTTDELRQMLKVPDGKLTRGRDLMKWALAPAVKAVSEHSRYSVAYTEQRGGRGRGGGTLTGVTLTWKEKLQAAQGDQTDTRRGLQTAQAGGGKPVPMPPFPDSGTLKNSPEWYAVARQYCREPLPDMTILADRFRARLRSEKVPLDGYQVLNMFKRFCGAWRTR